MLGVVDGWRVEACVEVRGRGNGGLSLERRTDSMFFTHAVNAFFLRDAMRMPVVDNVHAEAVVDSSFVSVFKFFSDFLQEPVEIGRVGIGDVAVVYTNGNDDHSFRCSFDECASIRLEADESELL